jgi:hypothetical protein
VEADDEVERGAAVGVVVVGVVVVAVADPDPPVEDAEADEPDEDSLAVDVVGVVAGPVVPVAEWAAPPDATRTPRPTVPADATSPMATVARRTRATARSRARTAGWRSWFVRSGALAVPLCAGPVSPFRDTGVGHR